MIKEAISKVVERRNLTEPEAKECMQEIMTGVATPSQIASFITALRMKGEAISEITGCARVMREKALKIEVEGDVVDTCGTGGDGLHTFNISTISSLVVAGAGVRVAKHGNMSVSSKCGSADLLKALGVRLEVKEGVVEGCIREFGIGFLFAPLLHGAMRHATPVRREIGIRSIFNLLGPLTNPASARYQLLGVYDEGLTHRLAVVLKNLGSCRVFVVHGEEGLDEISLSARTKVSELRDGKVTTYFISPEDFGFERCRLEEIKGGDIATNARIALEILNGKCSPKRDIVLLNASFAILASGKAGDIEEGIRLAAESIDKGRALEKLERLKEYTNR